MKGTAPAETNQMSLRDAVDLIEEEIAERGWSVPRMATAMAMADAPVWQLTLEMLLEMRDDPDCKLGADTAKHIALAFGMTDGGALLLKMAGETNEG